MTVQKWKNANVIVTETKDKWVVDNQEPKMWPVILNRWRCLKECRTNRRIQENQVDNKHTGKITMLSLTVDSIKTTDVLIKPIFQCKIWIFANNERINVVNLKQVRGMKMHEKTLLTRQSNKCNQKHYEWLGGVVGKD